MNVKSRLFIGSLFACVLTIVALLTVRAMSFGGDKANNAKSGTPANGGTPVIVELFTSEGCSSCPSADKVIADLKRTQPIKGARILVLSEHVDYWNNIGWRDPFSNSAFTSRQYEYGRKFRLDSVYTPQAIVDGQAEMVGSERDNLESAIAKSTRGYKAEVAVTPEPNAPDKVHVTVTRPSMSDADVMLAVTEDNLTSNVARGENSGRKLSHVGVVRELRKIGSITGKETFTTTATLELEKGWKKADLEAVVFVQERGSRRIVGANTLKLAAE